MSSLSPLRFSLSDPRLPGSRHRRLPVHGLDSSRRVGGDEEKETVRGVDPKLLLHGGNQEKEAKSGVPKGAATDSGDVFISVGNNVSCFASMILISNQGLSHVGFCVFLLRTG
ncbi:hypothetical protein Bca4012_102230 [Brassica carinata]